MISVSNHHLHILMNRATRAGVTSLRVHILVTVTVRPNVIRDILITITWYVLNIVENGPVSSEGMGQRSMDVSRPDQAWFFMLLRMIGMGKDSHFSFVAGC